MAKMAVGMNLRHHVLWIIVCVFSCLAGVASAQKPVSTGNTASAAGVSWTAPARWKVEPQRPMRVATYTVPAAPGEKEPGECGVFFFGAGQGGDVESNIQRWRSQFESPGGKPPALNRKQTTIHGLAVTTVSITGSYLASMGPMFEPGQVKKVRYKMLGAIVTAPQGNVFFKCTGPEKTIIAADAEFTALIGSLKK